MITEDLIFLFIFVFFISLTITFLIRYSNLLKLAQTEYERAKNVLSGIFLAFNREQHIQSEKVDQLGFQIEITQSDTEKLVNRILRIENQIQNLFDIIKSNPQAYKEVTSSVNLIKKDISVISEKQENILNQLNSLNKKTQEIRKEEKSLGEIEEEHPFSRLTETESVILQFLINEGTKTSSDVEAKIEKTREHTARLMKKLWQEGYIERDTHRIPYVYHVNEKLRKIDLKKL